VTEPFQPNSTLYKHPYNYFLASRVAQETPFRLIELNLSHA
jgi:hypothetical protein